jgi:glycosyltransferase involved in cell wall biosynthesis
MSDVSVVLCTYNGERFISEQLASILAQTRAPAEIIVSDDGSTDATLDIVATAAKTSTVPIRILENPHTLGFAENFLTACTHANTPYIAFSDQDDRWRPEKLATAHRALRTTGAALCVHPVQLIDSGGDRIDGARRPPVRTHVLQPLEADPWDVFYGFTMLFERSLLDTIPASARGADPYTRGVVLSHDRWIWFLAATFGRIVVLRDVLAEYRQHDAQLFGGAEDRTFRERIATKVSAGRAQARYLAGVAAHRGYLLESRMPDRDNERWRAGATHWRAIEARMADRARLYDPLPAGERIWLLAANARGGTYRAARHGGLGAGRFAEDVTVSILVGSRGRWGVNHR